MPTIRIFASFDDDHDADLHERLHTQSLSAASAFEVSAGSQGGVITEAWTENARTRIRAADEVVVICSEHTAASPNVATELRIAQEEGKPYLLLWGRRETLCTKPDGARPTDAMYSWTRDILEAQISATLRASKPREVPERCKRP